MNQETAEGIHDLVTRISYMSLGIAIGSENFLVVRIAVVMVVLCVVCNAYIESKFQ